MNQSAEKDAPRRWWQRRPAPAIHDVPCASCVDGYGGSHSCDEPDFCACDRTENHVEPPLPREPAMCHVQACYGTPGGPDA